MQLSTANALVGIHGLVFRIWNSQTISRGASGPIRAAARPSGESSQSAAAWQSSSAAGWVCSGLRR